MNGNANRIVLGVMTGLMAGLLSAETYTWCGGSGDWTNPSNWKDSSGVVLSVGYPNAADARVEFPASANGTVTLAEAVDLSGFKVVKGASVTLAGGGTITIPTEQAYSSVAGELVVTNLTLVASSRVFVSDRLTLEEDSSFIVPANSVQADTANALITVNGGVHHFRGLYINGPQPGAKLVVNGGTIAGDPRSATIGRSDVYTGDGQQANSCPGNTIVVNGGYLRLWPVVGKDTEWHLRGGHVVFPYIWAYGGMVYVHDGGVCEYVGNGSGDQAWQPSLFVFEKGSRMLWGTSSVPIDQDLFAKNCEVQYSVRNAAFSPVTPYGGAGAIKGTLVATNGATAGVSTKYDKGRIVGRPSLVVSQFTVPNGYYGYADVDTLVIGTALDICGSAEANFLGPVTLGAFGDWKHLGTEVSDTFFHGNVTVDTCDWFDKTTPHDVSLHGVQPDPGLDLTVKGGGSLEYGMARRRSGKGSAGEPINYRKVRTWHTVIVATNTTLKLTNTVFACDNLILEAGATLLFAAGDSQVDCPSVTADPTARIEIAADFVEPAADGDVALLTGEFGDLAGKDIVSVTGSLSAGYATKWLKGCFYLDDGQEPVHAETDNMPGYWTGAVSTSYNNKDNWSGGAEAAYNWNHANGKFAAFDGFAHTDVNNVSRPHTWCDNWLTRTAGPYTFTSSGTDKWYSGWGCTGDDVKHAVFGSQSRFPVRVKGPVCNYNKKCALIGDSPSYLEITGNIVLPEPKAEAKTGVLLIGGEVRLGGVDEVDYIQFDELYYDVDARMPRVTVLPGATVTVKDQNYVFQVTYGGENVRGCFNVCKGGKLVFAHKTTDADCKYDYSTASRQSNRIDGEMDILCPLVIRTEAAFRGTGSLHVAGTMARAVDGVGETQLADGISFTCDGWQTAWDDEGYTNFCQRLAVLEGTAYLKAPQAWTYGVDADVATEVPMTNRAIRIHQAGNLVLDCTENPITFADPIAGPGKLTFAEGAQVRIGGALLASKPVGKWIELARVGAIEGEPSLPSSWTTRTIANDDGTVSLMAREPPGIAIIIR